MSSHRAARLRFAPLLLSLAGLACSKDAQVRDDPAAPARSKVTAPSASSSAPPALQKVDVSKVFACDDGALTDPDGFGYGGLGLTGVGVGGGGAGAGDAGGDAGGGWGEGIGLGSIGGFGHGIGGIARERLLGTMSSLEGKLAPDDVAKAMCGVSDGFRACFEAAPGRASSKVSLGLEVGDDGHVTSASASAAPAAPPLETCINDVARKLVLTGAAGVSARARVGYTLDFIGGPSPAAKSTSARLTEVSCVVAGRLPPEVIKRISRANFPRFRACYEAGLKRDPKLAGLVTTRFVISTTGDVESAAAAGGTITDATLTSCVTGVFATLSFPEPEGGKVIVTYSLELNPPAP